MKKLLLSLLVSGTVASGYCQSTYDDVYTVMQSSCTFSSCHSNTNAVGGLDLEGSGASAQSDVYASLFDATPTNSYAQGEGYKLVFPGDPYRSSLYRKVDSGLDDFVQLHASEGQNMPTGGPMSEEDRELIRQWITFGAPETGNVVDQSLIADYYGGNGVDGLASDLIPDAPDPAEGYQIKIGPYFLAAGEEKEYFLRWPLMNDATQEIHRINTVLGPGDGDVKYSHHFIMFRYRYAGESGFPAGNPANYAQGLRLDNAHNDVNFVTALQESTDINLPAGCAFLWTPYTTFDMNTHFINYHQTKTLKMENYINVYYQPVGTAIHEVLTDLHTNFNISIPGDGQDIQFTDHIYENSTDQYWIWTLGSHTHKFGQDFDIFRRESNGDMGDQLYDAKHLNGDPNDAEIGFDYAHPPTRTWYYPFLPVTKNEGLIQVATYNNNSGTTVGWGDTSDDEMMITLSMYIEDTTGLGALSTGMNEPLTPKTPVDTKMYPNPSSDYVNFFNKSLEGVWDITLYNLAGQQVYSDDQLTNKAYQIDVSSFEKGAYLYRIQNNGKTYEGKIMVK